MVNPRKTLAKAFEHTYNPRPLKHAGIYQQRAVDRHRTLNGGQGHRARQQKGQSHETYISTKRPET